MVLLFCILLESVGFYCECRLTPGADVREVEYTDSRGNTYWQWRAAVRIDDDVVAATGDTRQGAIDALLFRVCG